jgi:hypothetical protein
MVKVKGGNRINDVYISNIRGKSKIKFKLFDSEDFVHENFFLFIVKGKGTDGKYEINNFKNSYKILKNSDK